MEYRIMHKETGTYLRDGLEYKRFNSRIEAMGYMEIKKIPHEKYEVVGYLKGVKNGTE